MAIFGQKIVFLAVPSVIPFIETLLTGLSDLWRLMWDGLGSEMQNILIGVAIFCLVYFFILRPFTSTGYYGAADSVSRSVASFKASQRRGGKQE